MRILIVDDELVSREKLRKIAVRVLPAGPAGLTQAANDSLKRGVKRKE